MIAKQTSKANKKTVTVVFVVLFSLFAIQSAQAAYYPSGPQLNVPVSTVTSGGWKLCFQDSFGNSDTPVSTMLNDCSSEKIMLAGIFNNQENIALLAAGERSAVFKVQSVYNEKTLNNGTYFYFFPNSVEEIGSGHRSQSIGFSLSPNTTIFSCDFGGDDGGYKLCRHISDSAGSPYFDTGYRIGSTTVFDNRASFQVYQQGEVEKKVTAPVLRQTSNLSFDQSFYGSDQISDPTGEISNLLKEINRKYGNLISIR
jgi:hypothetical protein